MYLPAQVLDFQIEANSIVDVAVSLSPTKACLFVKFLEQIGVDFKADCFLRYHSLIGLI